MDFAVQLGSGSTVVYKKNEGIILNEATKIAYTRGGKKGNEIQVVAIGNAAKRMQDKADKAIYVESPVVGGRIVDVPLAKKFFAEIFKKISGQFGNYTCLFCIPCSLTAAEVNDIKSVAYSAGASGIEFIPNVIASAVALGFNIDDSSAGLSVNISEGGTDVAAINFGGILAGGSIDEGGAAGTRAVRDYIEKKYRINVSERMAETAKVECATLLLNNEISYKIKGIDIETGVSKEIGFNGMDCYKVLLPIYSRIAKAILQVVNECSPDVINDIKSSAVFIGGGASSPTGLREFLTANLDMNVVLNADSVNAAIIGAGKLLNDKQLLRKIIKAN